MSDLTTRKPILGPYVFENHMTIRQERAAIAAIRVLRDAGATVHVIHETANGLRYVDPDTGVDHAPIAERITVLASHEHPARLIGSLADGATSVVFFPRSGRTAIVPTHRTRLSW